MTELREKAESVWQSGLICRGWLQNGENPSKFLLFFHSTIDGIIIIVIVFYINMITSLAVIVISMTAMFKMMNKENEQKNREIYNTSDMYLNHICVSAFSSDTTPLANNKQLKL